MTQDMYHFVPDSCALLGIGEPTHGEPAFALVRNELFARLVDRGFRSIALETDRVAALAVDDYVQGGAGTLESVLQEGFSHGVGGLGGPEATGRLLAWMREYNTGRPPEERLAFHGFDIPTEMMSAPSPRAYLEHVRDYLGLDLDIAGAAGADERWSRTEAVMDPAASMGATAEAGRLRVIADDLLTTLYARAPELVPATSRAAWRRARTHLTAGIGLLRYHERCAEDIDRQERYTRLLITRDVLMADNLADIRAAEAGRGPTLAFAHNTHLQRNPGRWRTESLDLTWFSAGAVAEQSAGESGYTFIAGSLGRSAAMGLAEPEPGTYEAGLQTRAAPWGLVPADTLPPARSRTDHRPEQGYFPLDRETVAAADAILHLADGTAAAESVQPRP
ncbi:erythromycin esterase family protein [Streptomonospora nanhaiensis]|nr:erythromycin esterase family protein [Streptomonospora nanhaiensis]MBX9390071.1 erythromycin esterase family protein [Streptomonospora nanhaiensis]